MIWGQNMWALISLLPEEKFVRHCAGQISFQYIEYINSYVYCENGAPSVGVTSRAAFV